MHLVQLLLPVLDQQRQAYPRTLYEGLVHRLTEQFGGVTMCTPGSRHRAVGGVLRSDRA